MKIATKLYVGFGFITTILAIASIVTIKEVKKTKNNVADAQILSNRLIELRSPTAIAGIEVISGINHSLASLRGWMILGKDKFKDERAYAWDKEIRPALSQMSNFSQNWTDPVNIRLLDNIKAILTEFENAQNEIETISGTIENEPATKILVTDAAPRANGMVRGITKMIDLEAAQEATPERKALLGMMADIRGSLGLGLANIRAFLLTGDQVFENNVTQTLWPENTRRFNDLKNSIDLLSKDQKRVFTEFSRLRKEFTPLPDKMFSIRNSNRWNIANSWLGTKAAPRAEKLITMLLEMKENQMLLLQKDANASKQKIFDSNNMIDDLARLQYVLMILGISLAAIISYFVTRSIKVPLQRTEAVADNFAKGDMSARVKNISSDEIGRVAKALNNAIDATDQAKKEADSANKNAQDIAAKANSAVDGSASAMIQTDLNLIVTYANPAARKLLQQFAEAFRILYPKFNHENIEGIDVVLLLENPEYQREKLSNFKELPYQTDSEVDAFIFEVNASPMIDANGTYIGISLELKDVTQAREGAMKAAMLMSLVESEETNVMTVTTDRKITYLNPAIRDLLTRYQQDIQTVFPDFNPENLIGTSIDDFHKNPMHQEALLVDPKNLPYKTEIKLGKLEFGLNAMALLDDDGNHIGNAVEWIDNNARARYRDEISDLINACKGGNLQKKGDADRMDEVYQPMLQGVNEVIEAIVAPIGEIRGKLENISKGNLTSYVTGNYEGDHNILKTSLNETLDNLNEILNEVSGAANQMSVAASQVNESSQSISQGSVEQASSLEEITASMTQISSQVKQNADNANQANQLSISAREVAENGNGLMQNMINAMAEIDESAKNIQKIIKAIDEIAFQTNLLALNAAVEAARAGIHGKGFAVVAEEVRNLAARSANAAKETTALIEGSASKVQAGLSLADETAQALSDIVVGVGKVTELNGEIASASKEQSLGINQINEGLIELDKATQANTAGSEQCAAAATELSGQASQLLEMLKRFTLVNYEDQETTPASSDLTPEILNQIRDLIATSRNVNVNGSSGANQDIAFETNNGGDKKLLAHSLSLVENANDIIPLDDASMGRY